MRITLTNEQLLLRRLITHNDNCIYAAASIKGNRFYFITDSNNVIYDYGKITSYDPIYYKSQLLPYGGSKAYNVYGYDENGYDNKGYKTDGYNDAGYDRDGYDKKGFNSDGYDREGYKTDGYNDAGYDKAGYDRDGFNSDGYDSEGYDRQGYNKKGYDREGYDRDGYNKKGYNEAGYDRNGWDKEGYNRNGYKPGYYNFLDYSCGSAKDGYKVDSMFDRNGIDLFGFDKNGVYKDGFIYTDTDDWSQKLVPNTYHNIIECFKAGEEERWHTDGRKVMDSGAWDSTNRYNFEVAVDKNIRNYYTNQSIGFYSVASTKGEDYAQTRFISGVLYVTVPDSYVNRKGKKTNIYYLGITQNGARTHTRLYKIKSKYMRIKLAYGDSVSIGNYSNVDDGSICKHTFSYKYVPSTKYLGCSSVSFDYKGKLINASETKVNITPKHTKKDIVYTSNMDYKNITVKSSNSKIVKAKKIKFMYSTKEMKRAVKLKYFKFDKKAKMLAVKLTGGSKKGTATVTIKDTKSEKTETIKVTNK